MTTSGKKRVSTHVPVSMIDKIDELAAREDRSRSWVVNQALAAWVAQEQDRERGLQEAIASIDAGRTVPHSEVRRWTESLGTDEPLPPPQPR